MTPTLLSKGGDAPDKTLSHRKQQLSSALELTKEKLGVQYRKYCALLKSFLLQYIGYIQSPARQEAILKIVQYTLWLLSRFYSKLPIQSDTSASFVESLATLSGELSWGRYIYRFFGLPAALEGAQSGSWAPPDCKGLGKAMAWTMIAYYPLEHLAYLAWKAPKTRWIPTTNGVATKWNPFGMNSGETSSSGKLMTSSQIAGKASAWSCRFWFAYLVLDIARSMMALKKVQQTTNTLSSGSDKKAMSMNGGDAKDEQNVAATTEAALAPTERSQIRTERLQIVRNVLYLLPAIHWSMPIWDTDPLLSNDVVNGLCWLEALVGTYQGIRSFREQ